MKILLDHGFSPSLGERLGELGYDVASASGDGDRAHDDASVLQRAIGDRRVLVTQNASDFLPIAGANGGPGVVIASPIRYPRSPLTVDRLVFHIDALLAGPDAERVSAGGVHWLETPPGCPFLGPPSSRTSQ